jgi:hypothetical protein
MIGTEEYDEEWQAGYDAYFQGVELVGPESVIYLEGYWSARDAANPEAAQALADLSRLWAEMEEEEERLRQRGIWDV